MKALLVVAAAIGFISGCISLTAQTTEWQWGTEIPGWNGGLSSTATDADGNTYVAGYFQNTLTLGGITLTSQRRSLVVAKMDTNGNWLWARKNAYTGTAVSLSYGTSIAVDGSGNVYLGGRFYGPLVLGADALDSEGYYDLFAAKLDAGGNWLWVRAPGTSNLDWSYTYSIAVDRMSNLYITGIYSGTVSIGAATFTSEPDCEELVAAKLDANGNWLWARTIDGSGASDYSQGYAIAVDSAQNVFVAGYFDDTITLGATTLVSDGYRDMFIAGLDNSGVWNWARLADLSEVSATTYTLDMECDGLGNVYLCGPFDYDVSFGTIPLSGEWGGNFIVKLDSAGNYQWAHQLGEGEYHEWGIDVAVDSQNCPFVTSYSTGTITLGEWTHTSLPDWYDIIVAKLDPAGNWLWAQTASDTSDEGGSHISLDAAGNLYVAGTFWGELALGDSLLTSDYYKLFFGKITPVYQEARPQSPQNVVIALSQNDVVLQWDPVTLDTHGQTITTDYYRIYYSYTGAAAGYYMLAQTPGTTYTHTGGTSPGSGFYRISAYDSGQ